MQGVGDDAANPPEPQRSRRGGLSPYAAGAVVLALIVGAGLVSYLTKPDAEPLTPGSQTIPDSEPDPATGTEPLTEAEAIETFRELQASAIVAVRERDIQLLQGVFTQDGEAANRASRAIRSLKRNRVIDLTRFESMSIQPLSIDKERLRVEETVLIRPCFETESGRDVTKGPAVVRRTSIWTLHLVDGAWLIDDAVLKDDSVVKKRAARCP